MEKPLQNITILVADDVPMNLMILAQVLTIAGAKVLTADNGRKALETLEAQQADIILMDLQMPILNGFEATNAIRQSGQRYNNIPIIAVTAETAPAEIKKCMDVGMNDFIAKPFISKVIYQKIIDLLHNSKENLINKNELKIDSTLEYNLTYLKEITNGHTDKLEIIVDNLIENAPLLLQQSIHAVQLNKWSDAAGYLHKLKGLIGLFFMPKVLVCLQKIEENTKAISPNDVVILEEIDVIKLKLKIIIDAIKNDLKNKSVY